MPCHLGHLALDASDSADLAAVMAGTTILPFLANEPFIVDADRLLDATLAADRLGRETVARVGDAAYHALHGG